MFPSERQGPNMDDPRTLGIAADDLENFFEHRKHDKNESTGVRASTTSLIPKNKSSNDYTGYDLNSLEQALILARQSGDLVNVISVLQAKVKSPSLPLLERKKILVELLLELLNARKLFLIDEHIRCHRDLIQGGQSEQQADCFDLAFELIAIVGKMETLGRWHCYFLYQRLAVRISILLQQKKEGDDIKMMLNEFYETGVDYLKRVVQAVELEFKIKEEKRGSAGFVYGYGQGNVGIGKDDKNYSSGVDKV